MPVSESTLSILLTARGTEQTQAALAGVSGTVKQSSNILIDNKSAFRELAMGMTQIGVAAMGVGVLMRESNNQMISNVGNMVMLAGGMMSAVGASVHFISAVSKMISALKALQVQQIITNALSGPKGWAILAGAAVATGAGLYALNRTQNNNANITVNNNFNADAKKMGFVNRTEIVLGQQRNGNTSGIK